jgi:ribosomal protein S18 acetylase RimI-like enzyme
VRLATERDRDRVVATVLAAFANDPAFQFFFPDPASYAADAAAFVRHLFDERIGFGTVWVVDGGSAVAMWNPPNAVTADLSDGLSSAALARLSRYDAAVHAHLPDQPHWYLGILATHPDQAGQAWGRLAMAQGLERARQDQVPAVLEAVTAVNVQIYAGIGFQVVATVAVEQLDVRVMAQR